MKRVDTKKVDMKMANKIGFTPSTATRCTIIEHSQDMINVWISLRISLSYPPIATGITMHSVVLPNLPSGFTYTRPRILRKTKNCSKT